jgi:hypothetical protein
MTIRIVHFNECIIDDENDWSYEDEKKELVLANWDVTTTQIIKSNRHGAKLIVFLSDNDDQVLTFKNNQPVKITGNMMVFLNSSLLKEAPEPLSL